MHKKHLSFLYLMILFAPCQNIKSLDKQDQDLLKYVSLYGLLVTAMVKITNHQKEEFEKIIDKKNTHGLQKSIQTYHYKFGNLTKSTNLLELQSCATSQSIDQELISYINIAKYYDDVLRNRYEKNNSPEMLQAINEVSEWSSELALMSIISKQDYLIKNQFLEYKIRRLEQSIMLSYAQKLQKSQPHSCANYNDPGPLEKAAIEIKNDIDFLEKNATGIASSECIIKRLRHCSNILETMPQYQNEKRIKNFYPSIHS